MKTDNENGILSTRNTSEREVVSDEAGTSVDGSGIFGAQAEKAPSGGAEETNRRTQKETRKSFVRRVQKRAAGGRKVHLSDSNEVAYEESSGKNVTHNEKAESMRAQGYDVTLCSGVIETNNGDVTTVHPYAVTDRKTGKIYISEDVGENVDQAIDHEKIHAALAMGKESAVELYDKVFSEIDFNGEKANEIFDNIEELNGTKDESALIEELLCYLYQAYCFDENIAKENYGDVFKNWDNVAAALDEFRGSAEERDLGFREPSNREIAGSADMKKATQNAIIEAVGGRANTIAQTQIEETAKVLRSVNGVVFSDKVPLGESYVDSKGIVHFNTNVTLAESYSYLFKHEVVHLLELRKEYEGYKEWLFNDSASFKKFMSAVLSKNGVDVT